MAKKALMVIAHRNFRDEELLETRKVLEDGGIDTTIASTSTEPARGMFGAVLNPDLLLDDVKVDDYEAIVFVGGSGAEIYFKNLRVKVIAREAWEKKKIVAAICIAPCILANADLLKGKRATVWNGKYRRILEGKGAEYTGETITQDGHIITANGPKAAKEFGNAIVSALE